MGENFIASDQLALLPVTRRFIFLEEGDIAEITRRSVNIFDKTGAEVKRQDIRSNLQYDAGDKGIYSSLHAERDLRTAERDKKHP